MERRIAIQGFEGSFHQMAARLFCGKNVGVIACHTFNEVIQKASDKSSSGGVMAIENSIAGSILPNYNLLHKSHLYIAGEIYLQVKQHLLVNRSVKLADIKEVHSHTMALQQCDVFLSKYKWRLIETDDTALSAQQLRQHKSKHIAAVASKLAAELYGLKILVPNIHTLKNNYTRFLFLQRAVPDIPAANKASVSFHTDHKKGSLAKVLMKIADTGINLSKLQSFPIPGSDFKYNFHADMEFDSVNQFHQMIQTIQPFTQALRVYGIYKKGLWK